MHQAPIKQTMQRSQISSSSKQHHRYGVQRSSDSKSKGVIARRSIVVDSIPSIDQGVLEESLKLGKQKPPRTIIILILLRE
jgi:hypothetical protein